MFRFIRVFFCFRKIQKDLDEFDGVQVGTKTIARRLHAANFNGRRVRKTPFLKKRHKKKRLEYAKMHQKKSMRFWKKVLWSDETKLEIWGSNIGHVWREPNTAYDEKNTLPTVKHPPSLML